MGTPAYSYLRFSTPDQMAGDSFRRQNSAAVEYCERNGLELDTRLTFHDLGVSAFRGKNAEAGKLGDFLGAVRAGLVPKGSYLLVESLDRLSRQSARKALRVLEDICEEGITVVTLVDGRKYTQESLDDDPTALLMSLLIFIRANEESLMKSRRIKEAWNGKRQQANQKPLTATGPGWLQMNRVTRTWEVIPEKAAVVQRIYREALEGKGQHAITTGLNRDGVPVFGSAGMWHRVYVKKILQSPAVVGTFIPSTSDYVDGKRVRKTLEPVPGYYPAVVDPDVYQRVRALQMDGISPARGKNASAEIQNIFGGILQCGACGGTMVMTQTRGSNKKKLYRYVVCSTARARAGCSYNTTAYEPLELTLTIDAQRVMRNIPAAGEDSPALESELEQARAKLEALDDAIAHLGETYRTTRLKSILEQLREVERERDEADKHFSELLSRRDALVGPLVERRAEDALATLEAPELDRRKVNTLLRTLFSSVVVNHQAGTLLLKWKHGAETEVQFAWPEFEAA